MLRKPIQKTAINTSKSAISGSTIAGIWWLMLNDEMRGHNHPAYVSSNHSTRRTFPEHFLLRRKKMAKQPSMNRSVPNS